MGDRSIDEGRLDAPGYRLGVVIGAVVRRVLSFLSSLPTRFERPTEIAWEDGEVEDRDKRR